MQARYGKDDEWPIEFIIPGPAPERERQRPIGSHFLGRMAGELLSPRSLIRVATMEPDEETIARMNAQHERMRLCPTMGGGGGMIMMGVVWILIVVALLLSIAALLKYLRSGRSADR